MPIALCNVVYKVITKILASRLKDHLNDIIHPSQAAFIPSRSILDNIIINHEIMGYINSRKGRQWYMAIKVDMAKAYDMVEWDILHSIILAHSFSPVLGSLIHHCVSSVHFSILVNGSPCGFLSNSRGIRQGDPIAVLTDLLSRILSRVEGVGRLKGITILRSSPHITYFMYADDLVIYCKATPKDAKEIKECLNLYCQWSGRCIN